MHRACHSERVAPQAPRPKNLLVLYGIKARLFAFAQSDMLQPLEVIIMLIAELTLTQDATFPGGDVGDEVGEQT